MQRNKLLAKEILETIVDAGSGDAGVDRALIHQVFTRHYPSHEVGLADRLDYHLYLLETAGFVKRTEEPGDEDIFEMTWAGHDFLEDGPED